MRAQLAQIVGIRFCRAAAARPSPVWAGAKNLFVRSGDSTKPVNPNQPALVAGRRPNAHRVGARRWKAVLTGVLTVVGVWVMSFAGSAAPASAATTTPRSVATAYWSITDGCVATTVSLESTQINSDPPTTAFFWTRNRPVRIPTASSPFLHSRGHIQTGSWQSPRTSRLPSWPPPSR